MAKQQKFIELPRLEQHQRYTIVEASALLRQSRAWTFRDIKEGNLRVIREGRKVFVPGSEIVRRSTLPAIGEA